MRTGGYAPIRDYAAIGDGRALALVARDGAVDWLPFPTMDAPTVFGALLDARSGGRFTLTPEGEFEVERRYLPRTNVLETTFRSGDGSVRVTDALTLQDGGLLPWTELARRIEGLSGSVRIRWQVEPRFGFAGERTIVERRDGIPVARGERGRLALLAWDAGSPAVGEGVVSAGFELGRGETALLACILVDHGPTPFPPREEIETRLDATKESWERWVSGHEYDGPWVEAVERSALALKLLTYAPSGAMMAAGTTSLPERLGADRNYDYRFTWVRDTSFALDALTMLGFREQVHASLAWLLEAVGRVQPHLAPLYTLEGRAARGVTELDLDGYRASRPVRRGNAATGQLQLGCYGDLLETIDLYVRQGNSLDPDSGRQIADSADLLCEIWRNDDSGIWELPDPRPYTISKIASWVALDRAIRLAEQGHVAPEGADRWRREAELVREYVEERCYSEERQTYLFHADADELDAATLLAARNGFADPEGERVRGTIEAVRAELGAGGPLLYRYSGQQREEGAFLACSFWLVEALARGGRLDDARETMDALLGLANDVGLYSEEIDPETHELLGNFPQGLTHLALINAAAVVAEQEEEANG
jgi:GH15 family glucan-1,4-alpha-glucosidase